MASMRWVAWPLRSGATVRPVRLLRVLVSEGLTRADSILRGGILVSVEFYRESPGKFDSRTPNGKTLNRWTVRIPEVGSLAAEVRGYCMGSPDIFAGA